MKERDKNQIIAIIATLVFHVVFLLILLYSFLYYSYPPKEGEPPIPKKEDIMFGGEYVMLGNVQTPSNMGMTESEPYVQEKSKTTQVEGDEMEDAGPKADASKPLISSKNESPMKVNDKPVKKSGPSKEEIAEQEKIKRQKEQADRISQRVSFGKTSGKGGGQQGSPNGNSSSGAVSGAPGVSGLVGYTLASWGRPNSPDAGIVRIRVRVNSRGKVISARYAGGSGSAAASSTVRQSCVRASLNSQFSVPENATTEAVGTITWRFE